MGSLPRICPVMQVLSIPGRILLSQAEALRRKLDQHIEVTEGEQRHDLRDLARELADWTRRLEARL